MRKLNLKNDLWLCCLMLLGGTVLRAQTAATCEDGLPPQVRKTVASKMKHWKVLNVADLAADDREIWEDAYDEKCPGVVSGQFGPQSPEAYAVTLIRSEKGAVYQTLVLVAEKNRRYQVTTLAGSQKVARPSIVRKLPRGSYSSAEGETQIDAGFEVVAFELIEAGTIIYYWSGSKYRSLAISE